MTSVFGAVERRVLEALRTANWIALRRDCCPTVAIEDYCRIYRNMEHKELAKGNFPSTNGDHDSFAVNTLLVKSYSRTLTKEAAFAFQEFCEGVQGTLESGIASWLRSGLEHGGTECESLIGPAISGKVVSNIHWRVAMEWHQGRWKVRRLTQVYH